MRTILTILIISLSLTTKAQCNSYDTIKTTYYLYDTARIWTYLNKDGSPAWKNVKGWDASLVPKGGSAVVVECLPKIKINGYVVWYADSLCRRTQVGWLDSKKKTLDTKGRPIDYSSAIKN